MKLWKVQKFFGDVIYDLRSRGLLPVVIALLIAMVAVPILISRGGNDSSGATLQPTAGASQTPPETKAAVVSYTPAGIRDYKQRLNDLSPKDPFRQQFAHSAAAASQLNSTVTTTSDATGSGSASPSTDSSTTGGTGGGYGKKTGKKKNKKKSSKTTTYSYSVTVMAGEADSTLTPFKNVASLTPLPSQTAPVVLYWGLSTDFSTALFLVSNKVDTLSGPGACVPAPDDCSLLTLAAGQSEDLHYGQDGKTYRVVVSEIKRVAN
jgi:hypothetical protein